MWAKLRNNTNILINHPYFIFKTTGMIFYKKFLKKIHACEIHFFNWWSSLEANGWCCFILEIRKATLTMDLQDDRRNSFFKKLFLNCTETCIYAYTYHINQWKDILEYWGSPLCGDGRDWWWQSLLSWSFLPNSPSKAWKHTIHF